MESAKKKDFVELKFTGYSNGNIFDSNIEEDLKKIDPDGKVKELVVVIGERMVVSGLDKALEEKEIGKEYEIKVPASEGFGERKRELVKTIPLKIFTEKQISPYPGMILAMDDNLARVITISGARVMTDFNNPLAGKDLAYKFRIVRKLTDEKEKAKILLSFMFKFVPEFEVSEKVLVKGPKILEKFVEAFREKFKDLIGKELAFEEKKPEGEKPNKEEKDSKNEQNKAEEYPRE
jgi:peptidylprolyl isomerase